MPNRFLVSDKLPIPDKLLIPTSSLSGMAHGFGTSLLVVPVRGGRMSEPMYRLIADDLRRQIESGSLPPGAQLKSEVELREEYGQGQGPDGKTSGTPSATPSSSSGASEDNTQVSRPGRTHHPPLLSRHRLSWTRTRGMRGVAVHDDVITSLGPERAGPT